MPESLKHLVWGMIVSNHGGEREREREREREGEQLLEANKAIANVQFAIEKELSVKL